MTSFIAPFMREKHWTIRGLRSNCWENTGNSGEKEKYWFTSAPVLKRFAGNLLHNLDDLTTPSGLSSVARDRQVKILSR